MSQVAGNSQDEDLLGKAAKQQFQRMQQYDYSLLQKYAKQAKPKINSLPFRQDLLDFMAILAPIANSSRGNSSTVDAKESNNSTSNIQQSNYVQLNGNEGYPASGKGISNSTHKFKFSAQREPEKVAHSRPTSSLDAPVPKQVAQGTTGVLDVSPKKQSPAGSGRKGNSNADVTNQVSGVSTTLSRESKHKKLTFKALHQQSVLGKRTGADLPGASLDSAHKKTASAKVQADSAGSQPFSTQPATLSNSKAQANSVKVQDTQKSPILKKSPLADVNRQSNAHSTKQQNIPYPSIHSPQEFEAEPPRRAPPRSLLQPPGKPINRPQAPVQYRKPVSLQRAQQQPKPHHVEQKPFVPPVVAQPQPNHRVDMYADTWDNEEDSLFQDTQFVAFAREVLGDDLPSDAEVTAASADHGKEKDAPGEKSVCDDELSTGQQHSVQQPETKGVLPTTERADGDSGLHNTRIQAPGKQVAKFALDKTLSTLSDLEEPKEDDDKMDGLTEHLDASQAMGEESGKDQLGSMEIDIGQQKTLLARPGKIVTLAPIDELSNPADDVPFDSELPSMHDTSTQPAQLPHDMSLNDAPYFDPDDSLRLNSDVSKILTGDAFTSVLESDVATAPEETTHTEEDVPSAPMAPVAPTQQRHSFSFASKQDPSFMDKRDMLSPYDQSHAVAKRERSVGGGRRSSDGGTVSLKSWAGPGSKRDRCSLGDDDLEFSKRYRESVGKALGSVGGSPCLFVDVGVQACADMATNACQAVVETRNFEGQVSHKDINGRPEAADASVQVKCSELEGCADFGVQVKPDKIVKATRFKESGVGNEAPIGADVPPTEVEDKHSGISCQLDNVESCSGTDGITTYLRALATEQQQPTSQKPVNEVYGTAVTYKRAGDDMSKKQGWVFHAKRLQLQAALNFIEVAMRQGQAATVRQTIQILRIMTASDPRSIPEPRMHQLAVNVLTFALLIWASHWVMTRQLASPQTTHLYYAIQKTNSSARSRSNGTYTHVSGPSVNNTRDKPSSDDTDTGRGSGIGKHSRDPAPCGSVNVGGKGGGTTPSQSVVHKTSGNGVAPLSCGSNPTPDMSIDNDVLEQQSQVLQHLEFNLQLVNMSCKFYQLLDQFKRDWVEARQCEAGKKFVHVVQALVSTSSQFVPPSGEVERGAIERPPQPLDLNNLRCTQVLHKEAINLLISIKEKMEAESAAQNAKVDSRKQKGSDKALGSNSGVDRKLAPASVERKGKEIKGGERSYSVKGTGKTVSGFQGDRTGVSGGGSVRKLSGTSKKSMGHKTVSTAKMGGKTAKEVGK